MKKEEVDKVKSKYEQLLEKKKSGETDWIDDVMLSIYRAALKKEEHELNKI